jgi:predicted component of type VI protein secretion system
LLPGQDTSWNRIRSWVLDYLGLEFQVRVRLVPRASEIPRMSLGRNSRLGLTSWLNSAASQSGPDPEDFEQTLF